MNKSLLSTVLVAVVLIGFSGCSKDVQIKKGNDANSNYREIVVKQIGAYTHAGNINGTNIKLLQTAAEETAVSGYQYFSFKNSRKAFVDDINTTDEFLLKCADKSVGASVGLALVPFANLFNTDDCGIFIASFSSANFILHKEKPTISALDANAVVTELKLKQLYEKNTDGIDYSQAK